MRRILCSLCTCLSLVIAIGLLAQSAAAEPYLQVSYDVIGGTFSGNNLAGAITGGSVTFTMPFTGTTTTGSATSTWFYCTPYGTGACGYIKTLQLTGTAGNFTLLAPAKIQSAYGGTGTYQYPTTGTPTSTTTYTYAFARANGAGIIYASSGGTYVHYLGPQVIRVKYPTYAGYAPTAYNLGVAVPTKLFHRAILGNEVRTVIPEPSTSGLLALGLGFLGIAGSSGGLAARARRARRK